MRAAGAWWGGVRRGFALDGCAAGRGRNRVTLVGRLGFVILVREWHPGALKMPTDVRGEHAAE